MTDRATLIDIVLKAPEERMEAILAVARGANNKSRPGTVRQAAEILGSHPRTIQRYAKAGLLHPIRISSRKIRWDLNEVERLATNGRGAA